MLRRGFVGLLVCVAGVAHGASLGAQGVRTADSLLRQGILQRAEAEYYAAARRRPRDPEARFALGKYLLDRGAFRIGTTLIDEAMQFGYDKAAGSAVLARAYINLGEYEAANRLPVPTLAPDEQAQVRWLAAHPSRLVSTDSSVLVAFTRSAFEGYLGGVRLRINGTSVVAMISPRSSCTLIVPDTSAVARSLHRFPATGRAGDRSFAAADSLALGHVSITNVPVAVERMRDPAQAVLCFGLLARWAPTFDPRANLMTVHLAGIGPEPSRTSVVAPILDIAGEYSVLRSGMWNSISASGVAAMLRDRRWTFDPRRRQITIEP
jgi:tetratricopeptide (TPR) repeat protein